MKSLSPDIFNIKILDTKNKDFYLYKQRSYHISFQNNHVTINIFAILLGNTKCVPIHVCRCHNALNSRNLLGTIKRNYPWKYYIYIPLNRGVLSPTGIFKNEYLVPNLPNLKLLLQTIYLSTLFKSKKVLNENDTPQFLQFPFVYTLVRQKRSL